MPNTLRLSDGGYMRRRDVQGLLQSLFSLECVQLIGFSNVGKSSLLRLIAQPDVWMQELGEAGHDFLAVYVDCNRMLDMSDQGFYELVLRCLQESAEALASLPELTQAYEMLVAPASEFQIPLAFNRGLTAALESTPRKIILLLDEFDEPFSQIDTRVFINLRALRDRHVHELAYVTATDHALRHYQTERHAAEFAELFNRRQWYLAPLTHPDVERLVHRYADTYEAEFITGDIDFVYTWAGGHPTLAEFVCNLLHRALLRAEDESERATSHTGTSHTGVTRKTQETPTADPTDLAARWELHRQVAQKLRSDDTIAHECAKIWEGCSPAEQEVLCSLFAHHTHESSDAPSNNPGENRQADNPQNGNSVHGNSVHGNSAHGNSAHGNSVHSNSAHGNSAHGNSAHGNSAHGNSVHSNAAQIQAELLRRYLLIKVEDRIQLFARLMADFVQRQMAQGQATVPESLPESLWVDVQSGEVLVDGVAVETLTNLEYKLMILLFENADKIVDKYQIVTEVWGESYIDEVDDTRIEKLVSRLRQKIEPDPSSPRFLSTVRGRGYRLTLANGDAC